MNLHGSVRIFSQMNTDEHRRTDRTEQMNMEEQIGRSRRHKDLNAGDGTEAHAIRAFYSDISRFMIFISESLKENTRTI